MSDLAQNKCEACNALTPKIEGDQIQEFLGQLNGWDLADGKLHKKWKFKNFAQALELVNAIGAIAEQEGHHPDIKFGWGYVEVTLWTHAIKGLSKNDFIVAAKIDQI